MTLTAFFFTNNKTKTTDVTQFQRRQSKKKKLLKQKKNWRAAFKVACGASRVLNFSKQWRRLLMTHKIASFSAAWRTYALRTQLGTELHQPMTLFVELGTTDNY